MYKIIYLKFNFSDLLTFLKILSLFPWKTVHARDLIML